MSIHDPVVHPALLDPRQWGDVALYDTAFNIEREPLPGSPRQTPERRFAIQHLKLDLRFDETKRTVAGAATLTLAPLNNDFDHFDLDIAEMSITSVRLVRLETPGAGGAHGAASLRAPALNFETHPERLRIELDRAYSRDEVLSIEIRYACAPRKGIYFIAPDESYPDKPVQIWSQGENEDAHWWFPCHDITHQKMSTELLATVNARFFALSNGELLGVHENTAEGARTFHWSQPQPHPAYLVSVVIGEYEVIHDEVEHLSVDYYVYKNRVREGRRLFRNTPAMIRFFEERFGCAYPYAKYSQVVVDDFLFGAMENTSASTFTDRCLLDDRAALDVNYDDIVAHELAHQWWGDLVTCKDWSQIWLNESFATYAEFLWREHTEGRDAARLAIFQDFLIYLNEDRTSHRRPILHNVYRYSEELMDRHAYEKGACVLDMLRHALGDDAFFRSLSHYLNKHQFGVAETNDFKVAIEEATGRNMHWFFDQWIYGEGYPELEVGYEWQRSQRILKLSVKQRQPIEGKTRAFQFPVEIEIVTGEPGEIIETEQRVTYHITIEQAEQDFYFPCDFKPRLVAFDKGNRVFKLMRFPKSAQELLYQLVRDDDATGRLRAARELGAFKSEEVVDALRAALSGGDFHGVRMAAAISLGEIATDSARAALLARGRNEPDPRVRRSCVWAVGNFPNAARDEAIVEFLRTALDGDESYFVGVAAARALAHLGGENAYDILRASLSHTSWQEVVASAVFHGFSHAKEKRAVGLALDHSADGRPTPLRLAAIGCLRTLARELRKDKTANGPEDQIVDRLIELLKDNNLRARVAAARALGKIGNPRALSALREAETCECLDQLKAALQDAIESLEKKK
jgi:aminopeptidase N